MRKWIKATKKSIGRHKVGVPFQIKSRDARIFTALGLAVECDPPEPEQNQRATKKKRTYLRRDAKPSVRAVMTVDDDTE